MSLAAKLNVARAWRRNASCSRRVMANVPGPRDSEEHEISRGGKATALWTLGLAIALIAGGVSLAVALRRHAPPPERPGTTSATNTANQVQPPSP